MCAASVNNKNFIQQIYMEPFAYVPGGVDNTGEIIGQKVLLSLGLHST